MVQTICEETRKRLFVEIRFSVDAVTMLLGDDAWMNNFSILRDYIMMLLDVDFYSSSRKHVVSSFRMPKTFALCI